MNHIVHESMPDDLWPFWLHMRSDARFDVLCEPCADDRMRGETIDDEPWRFTVAYVRDSGVNDSTGTVWCDECGMVVNPDAEQRANRRSGGW